MPVPASLTERFQRGRRAILTGVGANTLLAVVKIASGVFGNSTALVADGIESAMDVVGSTFIWGALKYAEKPPDDDHPYGHGKMESLAGVIGSLLLLAAGVVVAALSVSHIMAGSSHRKMPQGFTIGILICVIVLKESLFRMMQRRSREIGSVSLSVDAWHHRSDAITSLAAAIGITTALVGGQKWVSADDWAAIFSCGFIIFNGARMFKDSISEILDTQQGSEVIAKVIAEAESVPGVRNIEKCRVRKSGLTLLADIHVRVDGGATVREGHAISHQVKDHLMAADLQLLDVIVHIEPDPSQEEISAPTPSLATPPGSVPAP